MEDSVVYYSAVYVQEHHLARQGSVKRPVCLLAPLWPTDFPYIGYPVGPWLPLLPIQDF